MVDMFVCVSHSSICEASNKIDSTSRHARTQGLRENQDEDHPHEEALLLPDGAHARVPDHADGDAGGEGGEPAGQPRRQVREAVVGLGMVGRLDWCMYVFKLS